LQKKERLSLKEAKGSLFEQMPDERDKGLPIFEEGCSLSLVRPEKKKDEGHVSREKNEKVSFSVQRGEEKKRKERKRGSLVRSPSESRRRAISISS